MPEITLSLPIALGLMVIILSIGAAIVFTVLRSTGRVTEPTPTVTPSATPTVTMTAAPTATATPQPTFTPLPDLEYTIASGDTCLSVAYTFKISVQSVILANNLPAACDTLVVGQKIRVPQPTPTASPMPTNTPNASQATEQACDKVEYTVSANDTISGIAANYRVSIDAIKSYNGLTTDTVLQGQTLIVPLCERLPTPGATPTPTLPPPYAAPNLLLPADGATFMNPDDIITLQWAAVGELRQSESYAVTIEDVTEATGRKMVEYVSDTKFIVPTSFRPTGTAAHIFRWWVIPARQMGTTKDGQPIWDPAGASSAQRVFTWAGGPAAATTPTP